ncbi:hypothetical protein Q8F55_009235 [Vanrija albida]|uniref:Xylanolytic transcriptional activator regulatory domain-containing protein n=1 Tax=Vanrija albida TaxID=181172 RepID=A0ABR3PT28_9TREE
MPPTASGSDEPKKKRRRRVAALTCEQCTRIADQCTLYIPRWSSSPEPAPRRTPEKLHVQAREAPAAPAPAALDLAPPRAASPDTEAGFRDEMRRRMARLEELILASSVSAPPPAPGLALLSGLSEERAHSKHKHKHARPPVPGRLKEVCAASGVSPETFTALIGELPDQGYASRIVVHYFKYINPLRYPILENKFWYPMDDLYDKQATASDDLESLRHLPLVFIVLAIGVLLAPESVAGSDKHRRAESLRLYWCSRRANLFTASIQPESVELALAGLLAGMYPLLGHDRPLVEGWSLLGASVRTAMAVGLHRDGEKMGLGPFEAEYRRRIWSYFMHADRHYSLILGRPSAIPEPCWVCDATEPKNVDLETILPSQKILDRPLDEPTSTTFIILQRRLAQIDGLICNLHQKLNEVPTFDEVEALDARIERFIEALPPAFRLEDADTSHDMLRPYLPIQRHALGTEIAFARILLHRPWLLRKAENDKFVLSRKACFESAKMDFRLRKAFLKRDPSTHKQFFAAQFVEFNSAVVAGIAAVTQPNAADADEFRMILRCFLERHPLDNTALQTPSSQKEVAIITALYNRSLQVAAGNASWPTTDQLKKNPMLTDTPSASPVAMIAGNGVAGLPTPPCNEETVTNLLGKDIYATMLNLGVVSASSAPLSRVDTASPSVTVDSSSRASGPAIFTPPSNMDWMDTSVLFPDTNLDMGGLEEWGLPPQRGPGNLIVDPNPLMRWANSEYYQ